MQSSSLMPEIPVAGLVLLGLLALIAIAAWWRVPGAAARWRAWVPRPAASDAEAPRVRARQRLDAFSVVHDLEWADGRRLLVCTTRGVAPVVLDRHPIDGVAPEIQP